ncbi:hypothetical protein IJ847_00995 [Candidatus Saccharibacteria bacterium]|nr:hypothetical protein [Candidatus Saccharibacteria bacterium]
MPNSTTPSLRSRIMWRLYKMPIWKRILVFVLPTILAVAIICGAVVLVRVHKFYVMAKEIDALQQAGEDGNEEEFYKICRRTRSKDEKFAVVEHGTKNYLCSLTRDFNDIFGQFSELGVISILDINSLASDDDNLSESRKHVQEARDFSAALREKANSYFLTSGTLDFLDGDLDEDMKQDYFDYTIEYINATELSSDYTDLLDAFDKTLDTYDEALDYLSAHRADWRVEGESLSFTDEAKQEEYWQILDKLSEIANAYDEAHQPSEEEVADDTVVDETENDTFDRRHFNMPRFY